MSLPYFFKKTISKSRNNDAAYRIDRSAFYKTFQGSKGLEAYYCFSTDSVRYSLWSDPDRSFIFSLLRQVRKQLNSRLFTPIISPSLKRKVQVNGWCKGNSLCVYINGVGLVCRNTNKIRIFNILSI